jgi:hypothetical protein
MTSPRREHRHGNAVQPQWLQEILECIRTDKSVRKDFDNGGRLHIDRPLPFLSVHIGRGREDLAARDITAANASYLVVNDIEEALPIIEAVGAVLSQRFGAFLLLDIDELDHDTLITDDAPYLPPFEIRMASTGDVAAQKAATALAEGADIRQVKFRTPHINWFEIKTDTQAARCRTCKRRGIPAAPCGGSLQR